MTDTTDWERIDRQAREFSKTEACQEIFRNLAEREARDRVRALANAEASALRMSTIDPTDAEQVAAFLSPSGWIHECLICDDWMFAENERFLLSACMSPLLEDGKALFLRMSPPQRTLDKASGRCGTAVGCGARTKDVSIDSDMETARNWVSALIATAGRTVPKMTAARECEHSNVGILLATPNGKWQWSKCPECFPAPARPAAPSFSPAKQWIAESRPVALVRHTATSVLPKKTPVLRRAMHRAFHGKCQMCYREVALAEEMEVDHILPSSKTIDEIRLDLVAQGVEPAHADAFLSRRWHGTHDCVLNYTVLCAGCNNRKRNDVLDVAALSLMLAYTAKQAREVVAHVNARSR